jgi:2-succinyl-5-enolpyruvyl-6-hydroxy-3-cyclohexene-1-carboxylate synthase
VAPVPRFVPDVHGVIVVGPVQPADPDAFAAAVGEIARRLGWPVLADGVSPLRYRARLVPHLISTYDLILRHPGAAERLRPEVVLAVGDWPASKVLRGWLEASGATIWQVTDRADNRDALHGRTRPLALPLALLAAALPEAPDENGYRRMWTRYETKARAALDTRLEAETALFEPKAAWLLARHLPAQTWLTVAGSMPVRDLEYVAPPGDSALTPRASRGANGIDGTLSTALGVAHGAEHPAVLLTGDLAFLHDSNGLLLHPRLRGSLTVVLINNRGGGIFEHLPVAQFEPPFEEFFATPQTVDTAAVRGPRSGASTDRGLVSPGAAGAGAAGERRARAGDRHRPQAGRGRAEAVVRGTGGHAGVAGGRPRFRAESAARPR